MKFKKNLTILSIMVSLAVAPAFANDVTEAKLYYNKGIDFYKIGQYDKSMEAFRKAIDLDPAYIDAYYNLGSILEYLEQDEAALTVFKQIVIRKPSDYEAVYKAANLSTKLGQIDKAKSYLALIPTGSYVNPKAQQLAKSLNTDLQTIKHEQKLLEPPKQPSNNGIYENIASPTGITSDKSGNLYVAGYSDNVIYRITPAGDKVIFLKDNRLNGPIGLVSDNLGNIYVSNYNANNVLKIDKTGFVTIILEYVVKPYGLHISDNTLFVSSQGENSIVRFNLD
ncbi:MAG: tetratricopeptide repeat protein [Cyanobacteria bacterium SIG32]|nr:tetratricopeptide repeat protein [Cyanobacteria bacterium SIG32]